MVLFMFDFDLLRGLPAGSDVVTKKNPVHWQNNEPDSERWFQSVEEVAKGIRFGNLDKMAETTNAARADMHNRLFYISPILPEPLSAF